MNLSGEIPMKSHFEASMRRLQAVIPALLLFAAGVISFNSCGKSSAPNASEANPSNVDAQTAAWLKANCQPFHNSKLLSDHADLACLKGLVGDARVVALGEATHGTKEFFQMKHRILEYLVTEMGFNMFAIEATWPESNLMNDYVQTGAGDAARLLAGLYFWTWNTQEVLDMILWMRSHNKNPGGAPTVSFAGFDMQFPRMAIDNVVAYLQKVDAAAMSEATTRYAAYRPYQDQFTGYSSAPESVKTSCRENLADVYESLAGHHQVYAAKTSEKEFAIALRSARVAIQAEAFYSGVGSRDQFMAENAQWLLNQGAPGSKIVLWAHNYHVSTQSYTMGNYLRSAYGHTMVVFGFDFYRGSFNAVTWNAATSQAVGSLTSQIADTPPADSYEQIFRGANIPMFFLDLRKSAFDGSSANWLLGPHRSRSIGAVYDQKSPLNYYYSSRLPNDFDVVIYFQDTSPSTLLPFYNASIVPLQLSPPPLLTRF
jgi:erythromycin esterase